MRRVRRLFVLSCICLVLLNNFETPPLTTMQQEGLIPVFRLSTLISYVEGGSLSVQDSQFTPDVPTLC